MLRSFRADGAPPFGFKPGTLNWRERLRAGLPLVPIAGGMPQDVSAYVPEVWAREALIWLRNRIVMAKLVYRDFENDVAVQGSVINIRRPMTFIAQSVSTFPITPTDLTPDHDTITLDQWKHVTFTLGDRDATLALKGDQGSMNMIIEDHIKPAAAALAEAVDGDLFGLYADLSTAVGHYAGTYGVLVAPGTIVDAGKVLNDQRAPSDMRYIVVATKDSANLLKQPEFTQYQWDPTNVDALRNASFGPKYGFNEVAWSQLVNVSVQATPPDQYHGLAFHRNAFALVMRPLEEGVQGAGSIVRTITDPDSGLAVRLEMQRSIRYKTTDVSLDILYGVKTLDANLACVVRS